MFGESERAPYGSIWVRSDPVREFHRPQRYSGSASVSLGHREVFTHHLVREAGQTQRHDSNQAETDGSHR